MNWSQQFISFDLFETNVFGCTASKWVTANTRGERIVFWRPNTNTNIIRASENDRIRIRIIFDPPKMTEYEYEYYSVFQKWPNTNTNNIRSSKNDRIRIRIIFGPPKMTEYEYIYYPAFQKWPNTNLKGQKFILVAFVWFISTVYFQTLPQIACLNFSPLWVLRCLLEELGSEQAKSHWTFLQGVFNPFPCITT